MLSNSRRGEPFFLIAGLVLAAIVVGGFVPSVLARPGGAASMPLLLHVHGAVFFAWFAPFCTQANLIRSGNVVLHRSLGKASPALAGAIVVLGYFVVRGAYVNPDFRIIDMPPESSAIFPTMDIVGFIIAFTLAYANRRNPAAHKRLMLLTGILIIDPAASRLVFALGGPAAIVLLLEVALLGAVIAYDLVTRRRPHWTSLLGVGLYFAGLAAKLTLARQPAWLSFADAVFG